MKKRNTAWIGLIVVMSVVLGVLWMSCREIPNEDSASNVMLNVYVEGAGAAAAVAPAGEAGKMLVTRDADVLPATAPAPAPGTTVYHLKITISNPTETWYVYNYVSGVPITLQVASGSGRVVDVEVYEVYPDAAASTNVVPATHFITSTPLEERTLDIQGEAVSIHIMTAVDPGVTSLDGDTPYWVVTGSTTGIPIAGDCPTRDYYANISDLNFGINFPTIPVTLYDGSSPPNVQFSISNLVPNRAYSVLVWHQTAGFYAPVGLMTGSSLPTNVGRLIFQGFQPRQLWLNPSAINGISPGDSVRVAVSLTGGFGNLYSMSTGIDDTCSGFIDFFNNEYVLFVPQKTSCRIHVAGYDCDGSMAENSMMVYTNLTPTCSVDAVCEESSGENNASCPADCYCGDGVCFAPYEDHINCGSDCGA